MACPGNSSRCTLGRTRECSKAGVGSGRRGRSGRRWVMCTQQLMPGPAAPSAEDVEAVLLQIMEDEFSVVVEDGSAAALAAQIVGLRAACEAGDTGHIVAWYEHWRGHPPPAAVPPCADSDGVQAGRVGLQEGPGSVYRSGLGCACRAGEVERAGLGAVDEDPARELLDKPAVGSEETEDGGAEGRTAGPAVDADAGDDLDRPAGSRRKRKLAMPPVGEVFADEETGLGDSESVEVDGVEGDGQHGTDLGTESPEAETGVVLAGLEISRRQRGQAPWQSSGQQCRHGRDGLLPCKDRDVCLALVGAVGDRHGVEDGVRVEGARSRAGAACRVRARAVREGRAGDWGWGRARARVGGDGSSNTGGFGETVVDRKQDALAGIAVEKGEEGSEAGEIGDIVRLKHCKRRVDAVDNGAGREESRYGVRERHGGLVVERDSVFPGDLEGVGKPVGVGDDIVPCGAGMEWIGVGGQIQWDIGGFSVFAVFFCLWRRRDSREEGIERGVVVAWTA
ncbi:hypothetical protein PMAC_001945 [Pneumocystis sp. 'macacae']|nr:hypothetical protein PMAC_001945 [Pneumocystis sp. 'macacae']